MSDEYRNISRKGMIEIWESKYGYCECGELIKASLESRPLGDTTYNETILYCPNCS